MAKRNKLFIPLIAAAVSIVLTAIDQLTKWLAVTYVKPEGSISLLKIGETEWINWTYCENTGMSFSMLEGQRVLLIVLPVLLIGLVEWYIFSGRAKNYPQIFSLAVVAGGGLGNLIDRVFNGYVVDFIDFRIINFAIFNFADICAVCGGIVFAVLICLEDWIEKKKAGKKEEPADEQA